MKTFKEILEGSGAGDVAGFSPNMGLQKRHRNDDEDCPCKKDPDSEECKQHKKEMGLTESPVGKIGRTGIKDAEEYVNATPELRAEFKKIVKKLGGVTVAKQLLMTMNAADKPKDIKESRPTRISNIFLDLNKCKDFQLIDMHGTYSGFVGLVRYKDGNAYEISVIPAEKSNEFLDYTTKG